MEKKENIEHNNLSEESSHHNFEYKTRCNKAKKLEESGKHAWPEALGSPIITLQEIHTIDHEQYHDEFTVVGRIRGKREHGKTIFLTIEDQTGSLQLYAKADLIPEEVLSLIQHTFDNGDYVWASGTLFITKMGELTLKINRTGILSKCLRPIPNSFSGFHDIEMRYRQRYVDLLVHKEVREVFKKRSLLIREIRNFLDHHEYLEVETPMLHPIPGGALAKPFVTHHNALDTDFFLRIAPELYLKRLIVGGFERVYEINKNFRNEGISVRHNPEFTMLEFYTAHKEYNFIMDFTEKMIQTTLMKVCGSLQLPFHNKTIDFEKSFERISPLDAVVKYGNIKQSALAAEAIDATLKEHNLKEHLKKTYHEKVFALFEHCAEKNLIQPTFIVDFPIEISPLAKRDPENPSIASRFELFIGGMEISNGFNELNDPFDQAQRFRDQAQQKDAGDNEAMHYDADYVNALEYGMPPTVGVGIGIDRLCMLATNSDSIKDVILFPAMKPNHTPYEG